MQARTLSQARILVLSAIYEPVAIVSWQKAMLLFFSDKVEVLEDYALSIRSVSDNFTLPCVIRLKKFSRPMSMLHQLRFSRKHVFYRDGHRCQYCTKFYPHSELTLDHVLPVVRGGETSWKNVVTACKKCNNVKAARTPQEAGMKLMKQPIQPKIRILPELLLRSGNLHPKWKPYVRLPDLKTA